LVRAKWVSLNAGREREGRGARGEGAHDDAEADGDGDGEDGVRDGPKGDGGLPSAPATDIRINGLCSQRWSVLVPKHPSTGVIGLAQPVAVSVTNTIAGPWWAIPTSIKE
jgi:hypothetical protein